MPKKEIIIPMPGIIESIMDALKSMGAYVPSPNPENSKENAAKSIPNMKPRIRRYLALILLIS